MTRFTTPRPFEIDANGDVLAGAKLNFYATNTNTRQNTYSDEDLTIANANPVVADGEGRFGDIFLNLTQYRVVLTNSDDVVIYTADNVGVNGAPASNSAFIIEATTDILTTDLSDYNLITSFGYADKTDTGGAEWSATGTTTLGLAGTTAFGTGFIYDSVGTQFKINDIHINVKMFGALGDGSTDDAAIINLGISFVSNGRLYFPPGEYLCASALNMTRAVSLVGPQPPATSVNSETVKQTAFLVHGFSGDFILCNGSATSEIVGSGGEIRSLAILNKNGVANSANGKAIVITGADASNKQTWLRLTDLEIGRYSSSYGEFSYGVDIDGSTVTTANGGVRDIFLSRVRIASDTGATASIRMYTAFNIFMDSVFLNLAEGNIVMSGASSGEKSSAIFGSNVVLSGDVTADHVDNVNFSGGRATTISTTANTGTNVNFNFASINNVSGISNECNISTFDNTTSRHVIRTNNANTLQVGRDYSAGDSTNYAGVDIGNLGVSQGSARIQYKNDVPASGTQIANFRLAGRNIADSATVSLGDIAMTQVAGTDSAQIAIRTGTERKILLYQQGNGNIQFNGNLILDSDNVFNLGSAGARFKEIFCANATINTSDARKKQQIKSISNSEKRVAKKIKKSIKKYKFNDAVEKKGDGSRIHFGVVAQEVSKIFKSEGLNPHNYSLFCYDEWDDSFIDHNAEYDQNGNITKEKYRESYLKAGNIYGIRYEELIMFMLGADI